MKLVPKDTPLERPYICFICDSSPQREVGEPVIDTEHQFDPPGFSNLRGKKYVCGKCAKVLGKLVGLVPAKALSDLSEELQQARETLQRVREAFVATV